MLTHTSAARGAMLHELRREQQTMLDEQMALEHELRWLLHHTRHVPGIVSVPAPAFERLPPPPPIARRPASPERAQVVLYGAHAIDAQIWALRACLRALDEPCLRAIFVWARAAAAMRSRGAARLGALVRCLAHDAERRLNRALERWARACLLADEHHRLSAALVAARVRAERELSARDARIDARGEAALAAAGALVQRARLSAMGALARRDRAAALLRALTNWHAACRALACAAALEIRGVRTAALASALARGGALQLGAGARRPLANALRGWRAAHARARLASARASAAVRAGASRLLGRWGRRARRGAARVRARAAALGAVLGGLGEGRLGAAACLERWRAGARAQRRPPELAVVLGASRALSDGGYQLGQAASAIGGALAAAAEAVAVARAEAVRARALADERDAALGLHARANAELQAQVERLAAALGERRRADALALRARAPAPARAPDGTVGVRAGEESDGAHADDAEPPAAVRSNGAEVERARTERELHAARARIRALELLLANGGGDGGGGPGSGLKQRAQAGAEPAGTSAPAALELLRAAAVQQRALAIEVGSAEAEAARLRAERPSAERFRLVQAQADADAARGDAAVARAARLEELVRRREALLAISVRRLEGARAQLGEAAERHAREVEALVQGHADERAAWREQSEQALRQARGDAACGESPPANGG